MSIIYLDNAATSWPKPEAVYNAVDRFMREIGASPGRSAHKLGLQASRIIYHTRELLAQLFHISDSSHIIFTASATEALNLALKGLLSPGDHIITTSVEHNSVMRPLRFLQKSLPLEVAVLSLSEKCQIDLLSLESSIRKNTRLIVVNHASNVTGDVMPIEEIGALARAHKINFLVDAAQTAGIIPIDVDSDNVDLLAFTGHKGLFGPQGTGGLYIRPGINLKPLTQGGTGSYSEFEEQPSFLPDKLESGTLNAPGIAGLGVGVEFVIKEGLNNIQARGEDLTRRLTKALRGIPGLLTYGSSAADKKIPVISFNLRGRDPAGITEVLSEKYQIMTRPGLHCAPAAHKTIGTFPQGTVRLSPGHFNKGEEIDYVAECIARIASEGA